MRRTFLSVSAIALAACSQEAPVFVGPPFSLNCNGVHNFEGKQGAHSFSATIAPTTGEFYLFDWRAAETSEIGVEAHYDGRLAGLDGLVRPINRISDSEIWVAVDDLANARVLKFDRRNGRYSFDVTSAGQCALSAEVTPIPGQAF